MATRSSAHIPVNCGVPVALFAKEWKSFDQRVPLAQPEARGNQRARCAIGIEVNDALAIANRLTV
jgi:hypothetical protein